MFPGIVEGNGKVIGEIYELPEDDLYKLDEAEDAVSIKNIEISLPRRVKVKVKTQSGQTLDAWCYIFIQDIEDSQKIPSGNWVEFSKSINQ
ncbi:MAG: gamma-glutamylcyclotransferase [Brevinematales bacterium]|nr:gamma-glutamylcyclotransferase [Brevinematales bacterium]